MIDYVASKGEANLPKYRYGYTCDNYISVGTCMKYEETQLELLKTIIKLIKSQI